VELTSDDFLLPGWREGEESKRPPPPS